MTNELLASQFDETVRQIKQILILSDKGERSQEYLVFRKQWVAFFMDNFNSEHCRLRDAVMSIMDWVDINFQGTDDLRARIENIFNEQK